MSGLQFRAMQYRDRRVADAIRDAVAEIVLTELADPAVGFVTVTRAHVSRDLKTATVYFSILGDAKQQDKGFKALEHARGFIRRHLHQHVKLRYLPELRFQRDETLDHERRVGTILDDLFPDGPQPESEDTASSEQPDGSPSP